jgi:hypothetical protein
MRGTVSGCKIMTEDVAGVNLRPKELLIEKTIISFVSCLELDRKF